MTATTALPLDRSREVFAVLEKHLDAGELLGAIKYASEHIVEGTLPTAKLRFDLDENDIARFTAVACALMTAMMLTHVTITEPDDGEYDDDATFGRSLLHEAADTFGRIITDRPRPVGWCNSFACCSALRVTMPF